jgi:predicted transcriptional regulator
MPPNADPLVQDLWLLWRSTGLTSADFARRAGVQQESFSRWMSGAWEPRLSTLRRVFKAFGYDMGIRRMRAPED